jgi:hypothetical protein
MDGTILCFQYKWCVYNTWLVFLFSLGLGGGDCWVAITIAGFVFSCCILIFYCYSGSGAILLLFLALALAGVLLEWSWFLLVPDACRLGSMRRRCGAVYHVGECWSWD